MNVQNPASAHYDTVHRFARHHNAISNFLGSARANDFDLADFGSVEAERSNLTSTAGPESLPRRMASMRSAEEMANLQKLSNEYRPDVEGDLVGKRESSNAITAEYAHADPVFVQKTIALPQKYSHYRTVKGDGNCGWRAIAFCYFETLLRLGDRNRIVAEETRLKSLNNLLNSFSYQEDLYEDFVESTIDLLRQISASLPVRDDGAALWASFNDPEVSSSIITHFRLLTSAFMKSNAELYQPFSPDVSIEQYCATQIEPYQVEIEHLGMNALIDALIKPAGFAVDIVYLDRSAGQEANTIRFELQTPDGLPLFLDAPTMRLLYRPGHYDILYKIEDVAEMMVSAQTNPQIALVPTMTSYSPFQATPMYQSDMLAWADIPGISMAAPPPPGNSFPSDVQAHDAMRDDVIPPRMVAAPPPPQTFPASSLPMRSAPLERRESSFRRSKYEFEVAPAPSRPFQTSAFEHSPFNSLHFMSDEFQPEIWTPDSESRNSRNHDHGRHRSRR